jgi:hypothetical protein
MHLGIGPELLGGPGIELHLGATNATGRSGAAGTRVKTWLGGSGKNHPRWAARAQSVGKVSIGNQVELALR